MNRYYSWLNTAIAIIRSYKGEQPLAAYLKTFFAAQKKYGSTDRRQISHLCYCYYRLGKLTENNSTESVEEMIAAALLLCSSGENPLLNVFKPAWAHLIDKPLEEKVQFLNSELPPKNPVFSAKNVFPWHDQLSEGIEPGLFSYSFFIQPEVYIRVRAGYTKQVLKKINEANIPYRETDKNGCIAFHNASKIEDILTLNKEAVVQDYNSQQVLSLIKEPPPEKINLWDCCAASGGKTILAADTLNKPDITVSDIRQSVLTNLHKRLAVAGISLQQSLVMDLTKPESLVSLARAPFDLVICDAPCSGSGTWSRTPEQLHFFRQNQIEHYYQLQKKIVSNVILQVKPGGYMLYITCSVFKMENEMIVDFLQTKGEMELIEMKLFTGYERRADTMFTALLKKPFPETPKA